MCSDHSGPMRGSRAGGRYYPKLQIAAPFPGDGAAPECCRPGARRASAQGAEVVCAQKRMSSAHATFIAPEQLPRSRTRGMDAALDHPVPTGFKSRVRHLRTTSLGALRLAKAQRICRRSGRGYPKRADGPRHITRGDITEKHWIAFWIFLSGYGARNGEKPYLTPRSFSLPASAWESGSFLILAL